MQSKICHITTAHNWKDDRIFLKECRSLAEYGFEVSLIAYDSEDIKFIEENVNIILVKKEYKSRVQRILFGSKKIYLKALEVDADIYHFHDPEFLHYALKLKKRKKKVIYDSHEDVPRQILSKSWIPKIIRKIISYIFEKYENLVTKKLTAIVTPTPYILNRFRYLNNNVFQVCNFPLMNEFDEYKTNFLNNIVGCYVGGISINRGIRQLVKATKKANIRLKLCGIFESKELENEITISSKHVNYLGFLDRKGVSKLLTESMIGFVTLLPTPNHVNSYPIKMFEYMAAGLPVIASNFPLWEEIIENCNCGICVDPNSVEEIETAINYLINNPDEAKIMGQNGRKAVIEKYNWGTQEQILIDLYEKL